MNKENVKIFKERLASMQSEKLEDQKILLEQEINRLEIKLKYIENELDIRKGDK